MARPYTIDLPSFAGPLDLLLHLIERQELDITAISLVKVTEQYLEQIEQMKQNRMEELIDFLVVAARLVQIKSRALLPQTPVIIEGEEEEDPAEALLRQLREYKRFKQAAAWLQDREEQGLRTYLRVAPPPKLEGRLDMSGITVDALLAAVHEALSRVDDREESVAIVQPRRLTIEGQINRLRQRAQMGAAFGFTDLLSAQTSRVEISITLLAVLELIKRQELLASQTELFGPIELRANPESAEAETAVT
ncbi:MAG: segregation/condensation protein A [Anaerolineaceae bacterium]|nr:segregation/condensation protein A [Anaerolineaceae bacterium]